MKATTWNGGRDLEGGHGNSLYIMRLTTFCAGINDETRVGIKHSEQARDSSV